MRRLLLKKDYTSRFSSNNDAHAPMITLGDSQFGKLLIVKIGALGDVLRTTCILPGLKQKFPHRGIHWLTSSAAAPLLTTNPLIDRLFFLEDLSPNYFGDFDNYDLLVNLEDSESICRLSSSLSSAHFIGAFCDNNGIGYTEDSRQWFDMSLISRFGKARADELKKANRLSYPEMLFSMLQIPSASSDLSVPEDNIRSAQEFATTNFTSKRLVIGLNTGAGSRWRYKQLSVERTISLAEQLFETFNANILLLGGPAERKRNAEIIETASCPIIDAGTDHSLLDFSALLALCDVLISSDSLALHIATALKIPVVAFFGPTSSAEIMLVKNSAKVTAPLPCSRCYLPDCDVMPNCMEVIDFQEILTAIKKISRDL